MRLVAIPKEKYKDYRLDLMFKAYKWDPQFLDNNTIAKYALVITEAAFTVTKPLTLPPAPITRCSRSSTAGRKAAASPSTTTA